MSSSAATVAAELFRGLSHWRGRRAFHPYGVGFAGELERLDGGAALPAEIGGEAIVRLSRSLGAPEWLPDPCGLALRVPDAYGPGSHQDLLLASSGQAPLARHLLLPSRGFYDRPYSSILPYRLAGKMVVMLALPKRGRGAGPLLAELRERDRGDLEFELAIASLRGAPRPVARLHLGHRLPADPTERLDFDPCQQRWRPGARGLAQQAARAELRRQPGGARLGVCAAASARLAQAARPVAAPSGSRLGSLAA
ncbi:MAG TPA: hypothetical protein VHQ43_12290 [Solirubrobacterales bacterium]|nr:hypothetical protein [Solirubrobacterales bacterium]